MRAVRPALAAVVALGTACAAEPEPTVVLSFSAPAMLPLTSCDPTQRTTLGLTMQAMLQVGGYDPTPLTVDPTTLAVTGASEPVIVGIVRPLGLSYWVPNPATSELVALAYIIGWVDLRPEALSSNPAEVTVDLTPNGVTAKLLSTNADVVGLADSTLCGTLTDAAAVELCKAEALFKAYFADEQPIDFDIDNPPDGVANIVEACNGTLF